MGKRALCHVFNMIIQPLLVLLARNVNVMFQTSQASVHSRSVPLKEDAFMQRSVKKK